MIVEVINTGSELLLGDILNTNFQYLSKVGIKIQSGNITKSGNFGISGKSGISEIS